MARRLTLPVLLGLAHGIADASAGFMLGVLGGRVSAGRVAMLVLLYNALAFAVQPAVGWWLDRAGRAPRGVALAGLVLMAPALVFVTWSPVLAVTLAGLGSAAFHVGGGTVALRMDHGRARGIGLFLAPGVVGLAVGAYMAASGQTDVWPFLTLLMLICVAVVGAPMPTALPDAEATAPTGGAPADLAVAGLVAAVALRSAVWTGATGAGLALALAAGLGKACGGFLADAAGWRRWVVAGLALAAVALVAPTGGAAALAGALALQSTLPALTAAGWRLLPGRPAMAVALTLGLATAIGGVPAAAGLGGAFARPVGVVASLLLTAVLAWRVLPSAR